MQLRLPYNHNMLTAHTTRVDTSTEHNDYKMD